MYTLNLTSKIWVLAFFVLGWIPVATNVSKAIKQTIDTRRARERTDLLLRKLQETPDDQAGNGGLVFHENLMVYSFNEDSDDATTDSRFVCLVCSVNNLL